MVDGLPRAWHHMRPVSSFCVSSLSGWLGCGWVAWVVGWVLPQGSELSFLVGNPRRLRTNIEDSGGSLRDLCPNSRRFVALSVCLRLPNLAAGGFKKINSLKSRPAPCQCRILIGTDTLAQAQLPSHLRRRTLQVLLGRLPGHPAQWIFGCAHLGPTAPLRIPWLTVCRANGTICALCRLSALLLAFWLAGLWLGGLGGWVGGVAGIRT